MKQKLIKCVICGKEEMRGASAKYCSSCAHDIDRTSFSHRAQKRTAVVRVSSEESFNAAMAEAKRRGLSYGEFTAAASAGQDVLERKTADNVHKVFEQQARQRRHDAFAKEGPVNYYTEDDSCRSFERRVFIRWYRGLSIKAIAQELDCPEKRVANCLHAMGCEANNGKRPKGLWELVETEAGFRVRPKEVQWTLDV